MRRSWLGLQLVLLSCTLLLAVVTVEGRRGKEEDDSSEEEPPCEKRHHCVEECCRCHHEEEDCCCERRCHHEEEDCCCERRCHHEEEDCCCERRCHHEEEDCCCERRHHHKDEECCKEKHSHRKEESGKKKHSHGKKELGRKKHSHVEEEEEEEEEEADEDKDSHAGKKHSKKRRLSWKDLDEAGSDSSKFDEILAKLDQQRIEDLAAQGSEAAPHYMKEKAIAHFNRGGEGRYYKHLEDGQLEFKKAIGVMVYVKMLLGETDCTKTEEEEKAGVEYSRAYLEKEGCQLLPQSKQQKRNCTFGFFIDMRTEKKVFVSQECTRIPRINFLKDDAI